MHAVNNDLILVKLFENIEKTVKRYSKSAEKGAANEKAYATMDSTINLSILLLKRSAELYSGDSTFTIPKFSINMSRIILYLLHFATKNTSSSSNNEKMKLRLCSLVHDFLETGSSVGIPQETIWRNKVLESMISWNCAYSTVSFEKKLTLDSKS